jgi:hypothetical protein
MHYVRALRKLSRLGTIGTIATLGALSEFAILITRHCLAIRTVATIAVTTTTTTATTWCIFAILDRATFGLWREQISLNRLVVKTRDRCRQDYFISLCWLTFLARSAGLTLTSFTGFAWFALLARWFRLALVSCLFRFTRFLGYFRLALLFGRLCLCAWALFLFVTTATAATTATTGTATAIIAFT